MAAVVQQPHLPVLVPHQRDAVEIAEHGLHDMGFDTLGSETPIIPVLTGDINRTLKLSKYLYENKIFAPAIRPPTVPEGKCRIRFTVTAGHTDEDIDFVLEVMKKAKDNM